MNADGSGQRRLVGGLSPAWAPDGSLIAFSGRAGLSVIRPDGTGLRVLAHTEGGLARRRLPTRERGEKMIPNRPSFSLFALYIAVRSPLPISGCNFTSGFRLQRDRGIILLVRSG